MIVQIYPAMCPKYLVPPHVRSVRPVGYRLVGCQHTCRRVLGHVRQAVAVVEPADPIARRVPTQGIVHVAGYTAEVLVGHVDVLGPHDIVG